MDNLITVLTYSHILAGSISLVAAPLAMAVAKGGASHRLWGKIFFGCMVWIFISATILSLYRQNMFLLLIGVFSFYNVWSGYRALRHKQLHLGKGVTWPDWLALVVAACFNVYFISAGVLQIVTGKTNFITYLALLFGFIGLMIGWQNLRKFLKPPVDKHEWLFQHISGFMGGFIASVTAFSTQTMEFLPGFLLWAWPTLVGSPIIAYWIRHYRTQLAKGVPLVQLVELKR